MSWFKRLFKKPQPEPQEPDAAMRLDFVRTFPQVIWVSSVGSDDESPAGFRYKLFVTRREPEMAAEILLLRETLNGPRRTVCHMQGSLDKLGTLDQVVAQ